MLLIFLYITNVVYLEVFGLFSSNTGLVFFFCSDVSYNFFYLSLFLGRSNPGMDLKQNVRASFPAEKTTFNWTIDGFSSLLDKGAGWTYSSVFEIMGVNWYA
jgi:hypothetical protein